MLNYYQGNKALIKYEILRIQTISHKNKHETVNTNKVTTQNKKKKLQTNINDIWIVGS